MNKLVTRRDNNRPLVSSVQFSPSSWPCWSAKIEQEASFPSTKARSAIVHLHKNLKMLELQALSGSALNHYSSYDDNQDRYI